MPSKEHTELTRRALCWLSNIATRKGVRGCPELPIGEGYVADAGAIMNLQLRWAKLFLSEDQRKNREIDSDDYTFIIESKASRGDFRKTFCGPNTLTNRSVPRANFHFVVVAKGVLPAYFPNGSSGDMIPEFWGVLEQSGNGLRMISPPSYCPQPLESIYEFGYRILRYANESKYMIMDLKETAITE